MKFIWQTVFMSVMLLALAGCGQASQPSGDTQPEDGVDMNRPAETDAQSEQAPVTSPATATPDLVKPVEGSHILEASVRSEKQRTTSPAVPGSDLVELVAGNNALAVDLYHRLTDGDDNLFYAPSSISWALAMTYAGARTETERQMAETLHFTLPPDRLHPAFNGLDLELARRGEGAAGRDGAGFRLHIVNALWGQQGYQFLPEFLDLLAENYGAGLNLVDFVKAPEEARLAINAWVSAQTEDRIKDLIPAGRIDSLTRLVLTNAIYFNAAWSHPFDPASTQVGPFHLPDGSQIDVPMMRQEDFFGYVEGAGYQAVELPYDGDELTMVFFLPPEDQFESFEDSLDLDRLNAILSGLTNQQVALTMPKFEVEAEFSLAKALAAMGMPDAFSVEADFSGMDGSRDLFISDILHKAFVSVDEAGTEAAAATAVIMALKAAMPDQVVEVTLDRPFIFLIRDVPTGSILFMGRVLDPGA